MRWTSGRRPAGGIHRPRLGSLEEGEEKAEGVEYSGMYDAEGWSPSHCTRGGVRLGKRLIKGKEADGIGILKKAVVLSRMFEQFSFTFLVSVRNDSVLDSSDEKIPPLSRKC